MILEIKSASHILFHTSITFFNNIGPIVLKISRQKQVIMVIKHSKVGTGLEKEIHHLVLLPGAEKARQISAALSSVLASTYETRKMLNNNTQLRILMLITAYEDRYANENLAVPPPGSFL